MTICSSCKLVLLDSVAVYCPFCDNRLLDVSVLNVPNDYSFISHKDHQS